MTTHSRRQLSFCYPAGTEEVSGCEPTIVEKSAHEKLGPGHYLDVDPSRAHRERYGIGDTGGQPIPIDFLHPVDGYLCPEYDLEQEKRETFGCAKSKGRILSVLSSFADICTPSAWLSGCVTLDIIFTQNVGGRNPGIEFVNVINAAVVDSNDTSTR
jgi:hypothetical protein